MVPIGFKVFSVIAGGVMFGTLGAMHVNPVPKDPVPQPWQLNARAPEPAADAWGVAELGPEDIAAPRPDGFAPDWAEGDELWEYPVPRFAEWEPEPLSPYDDGREVAWTSAEWQAEPEPAHAPAEPEAAPDVQVASAPQETPRAAPGDERKAELALAGLY